MGGHAGRNKSLSQDPHPLQIACAAEKQIAGVARGVIPYLEVDFGTMEGIDMARLEENVSKAASDPDESELNQQELDDVTGGSGPGGGGPPTPHH